MDINELLKNVQDARDGIEESLKAYLQPQDMPHLPCIVTVRGVVGDLVWFEGYEKPLPWGFEKMPEIRETMVLDDWRGMLVPAPEGEIQ